VPPKPSRTSSRHHIALSKGTPKQVQTPPAHKEAYTVSEMVAATERGKLVGKRTGASFKKRQHQ